MSCVNRTLPSKLFSRKEHTLPEILSQEQTIYLFQAVTNIKHRCMIALLYGAGLRLNELRMLKIRSTDGIAMQTKVVPEKGNKDRFTILPKFILDNLRRYYRRNRPKKINRPDGTRAVGRAG